MRQTFDTVAFCYDIPTAIDDGYLVDIVSEFLIIDGYDLSRIDTVMTTDGDGPDVHIGKAAKMLEGEKPVHAIVHPTIDLSLHKGEKTRLCCSLLPRSTIPRPCGMCLIVGGRAVPPILTGPRRARSGV